MPLFGDSLPDFPWDSLVPYRTLAAEHSGGLVDLSVGTPVDPTPAVVADALAGAAQWPGYPTTVGTPALREAMVAWWQRRRGVTGLSVEHVLPTVGSKEAVALLPAMLGLGAGDAVLHPRAAYPTYDVGARLTGAVPVPVDLASPGTWIVDVEAAARAAGLDRLRVGLVWVNSPGNPDGSVLDVAALRAVVAAARELGAVVASDECYAELGFAGPWADPGRIPSLLDPAVVDAGGIRDAGDAVGPGEGGSRDRFDGLLALYSLSKQSNLAGYRAAMLAGDHALVGRLREIRKHSGLILPGPVQDAMTVALGDDAHVDAQRETYRRRRAALVEALPAAGLSLAEDDVAGLYLWLTLDASTSDALARDGREWDCWDLVDALARRGVLVAPGGFYGELGRRHVRVGLNGTDEAITAAARRLAEGPLLP